MTLEHLQTLTPAAWLFTGVSMKILSKITLTALLPLIIITLFACGMTPGGTGESHAESKDLTSQPEESSREDNYSSKEPELSSDSSEDSFITDQSSGEESSGEESEIEKPVITYFGVNVNGKKLEWEIRENLITLTLPYTFNMADLKNIKPEITADGVISGLEDGFADLTKEFELTVTNEYGVSNYYTVKTDYKYLSLPVVFIEVEDGKEILSKEIDLACNVRIVTDYCEGRFPFIEGNAVVHGRGHYSWQFDKKSYTIKFDQKQNVLGLGKAKRWVLTANYTDKSLLQNFLALEMAKELDNLDFCVTQYPVDLFVNGVYRGVYTLGEKVEVRNNRIELDTGNPDETAFLIEIGGGEEGDKAGVDYFNIGLLKALTINYPKKDEITDKQREYILDYLKKADQAVRDLENYEDFIDIDSLIDWAILYEFTSNLDGVFRRSTYIYKDTGGKLKMGPVWDFDLAFGHFLKYEENTFACIGGDDKYVPYNWMNILYKDESFRQRLRERWDEVKDELYKNTIDKLEYMAGLTSPSAKLNFQVWDILNTRVLSNPRNWNKWITWEAHIQRLYDYLEARYDWLDKNL